MHVKGTVNVILAQGKIADHDKVSAANKLASS